MSVNHAVPADCGMEENAASTGPDPQVVYSEPLCMLGLNPGLQIEKSRLLL